MDGFGVNEGIIVMAATNRVDILDPAILRPGRFDRKVAVGRPDAVSYTHLLEKGLNQGKAQSILELLEESGPVTMKTRKMILDETDAERLSVLLKAAARAGSEADFLSKIC